MPESDPVYNHNKIAAPSERKPITDQELITVLREANGKCIERTRILLEMLGVCRQQFDLYVQSHRAKGTEDGNQKAKVNEDLVKKIDETITNFRLRPEETTGLDGIQEAQP